MIVYRARARAFVLSSIVLFNTRLLYSSLTPPRPAFSAASMNLQLQQRRLVEVWKKVCVWGIVEKKAGRQSSKDEQLQKGWTSLRQR
jgi:hypothetical protein